MKSELAIGLTKLYSCPHCNSGPLTYDQWWTHMGDEHPWLQTQKPADQERTDLGYGEDLKTTTVPTHDLPNEPGFTPEKFGWREAAQIIPNAHRMVWLSQPNDNSLKYWHHKPSNTTYAWDTDDTGAPHHLQSADDVEDKHGEHPYFGNNPGDWEGGFYEQNGFGKHPADLWGLPSSTDYATVQGDGDYGNSVF